MKLSKLIETLLKIQKEQEKDLDVVSFTNKYCTTKAIIDVELGYYDSHVGEFTDDIGCSENETEFNCVLIN